MIDNKKKISIMKKVLMGVAFVSIFAACSTKKDSTQRDMLFLTDTSNLYQSNLRADTALTTPSAPVVVAPTRPRSTSATRTSSSNRAVSNTNSGSGTVAAAPAPAKKGWSKAAKGAAIGGVAGAAAGAIITKSGKGAIIGGVLGAGGGYIIGRGKDKKDGRVN
jgi:hypothetical protein